MLSFYEIYMLSGISTLTIAGVIALVRFWSRNKVEFSWPEQKVVEGSSDPVPVDVSVQIPTENLIVRLDDATEKALQKLDLLKELNLSQVKIPPIEFKQEKKAVTMGLLEEGRFELIRLERDEVNGGRFMILRDNGLDEQYLAFLFDNNFMVSFGNVIDN
ncbi:MAG: hypothetical protein ACXABY_24050 [Candidatus Thorarchaeota archaeon]|jgi:hypothetical protein